MRSFLSSRVFKKKFRQHNFFSKMVIVFGKEINKTGNFYPPNFDGSRVP